MRRASRTMRALLGALALAGALTGLAPAAVAQVTVSVTGPDGRGPQAPDADGRFRFENLALRRNAENKFKITASDGAGGTVEKEVAITQLSLDSIVVASVKATPLPPERVIQLVEDGVIDLEDPENFNVSTFQIVLTIGQEPVPIEVAIPVPKQEPLGAEPIRPISDPGAGRGSPRVPDTEIVVFDQVVPCETCVEPPRIPGVIIIEGNIRSLKEFFSVRLLLMNMSGLFTLTDVKASLEFPSGGLSSTLPADGVVAFDEIGPGDGDVPGQKEREFIVRGDEIGRRPIRVSFGGFVRGPGIPEDEPVPFNGAAETAVEVKGPPDFLVRVSHPARVEAGIPYQLLVDITNAGDSPALFASLDLDVGDAAELAECTPPAAPDGVPECEEVDGPVVRQLPHLYPGDRVVESFTVIPGMTGDITSCIGVSSQNLQLQVLVGSIGCLTGKLPATQGVPAGVPTVSVVPYPGALGVGIDSPVVAFFSERMLESSIALGAGGTFRVYGPTGEIAPGRLRFAEVSNKTVAIWQAEDGITNRLAGNARYTVQVDREIRDLGGEPLFTGWLSTFHTTDPRDDRTPPQLTLGIEPGVDPMRVLPGQIVQVNAYAADQGTGVARVELRLQDQDVADAPLVFVDQKTRFGAEEGPTLFAIDTASLVPGHTYQVRATALDAVGNAQEATIPFFVSTVVAPPAITLPDDPAAPVLHGISLPLTPIAVSPTVKSAAFFLDGAPQPFATVTLPPFQATLTTLGLALGEHTVRAVATDALGRTAEDTLQLEVAENRNEPVVTFGGATDGTRVQLGAPLFVNGSAADPTGIASLAFFLDAPGGAPLPAADGGVRIETASLAEGAHRLYLIATNGVGVSNDPANPDSFVEFEVVAGGSGPAPAAPTLAPIAPPAGGLVTVQGSAPPGSMATVRNLRTGLSLSLTVDAAGTFRGTLPAAPGDEIEAIVVDLATSPDPSAPARVTVPAAPTLVGLSVAPASFTLATANAIQALTVTGSYSDGSSADLTAQAAYSSSAPAVASVSAGGTVVAQTGGTATITASVAGRSATATASVTIRTLQSISVSPPSVVLPAIGASQPLVVTGRYSDGSSSVFTGSLAFSSSAPAVIDVTGGTVRALAAGSAVVTVSASGVAPVQVPVQVDVGVDQPPAVEFLAPASGARLERGETVTVTARATDAVGVTSITLTATGATSFSETRPVAPPAASAERAFSFPIALDAAFGDVTLALQAEDTGGNRSTIATRTIQVVDETPPQVSIQAPAVDAAYGYDDEVEVVVAASDAGGVAEIRFDVEGLGVSGTEAIVPPGLLAGATFRFRIPVGLVASELRIRAFARDAAGNEGAAAPVPIVVSDADRTPPETVATAAGTPAGALTTVQYQVTSGLEDLDHVELYFRRNGIGTFNRYTGPLGTDTGEYPPPAGSSGTIVFDATRSGGDGSYEFFTVGVDRAGNREDLPRTDGAIAGDPGVGATIATGAPVVVITTAREIADASLDGQSLRIDGATVTLVGSRAFANVELVNGAVLTHRETTSTEAFGLELEAWTLSVDATSRIDVVGRGYLGGGRSGLGNVAHTTDFGAGAGAGSGGSHGGLGGDYPGNGESAPNPVYGSLANPVDLGSGGGSWNGNGGDGGGRVLIGVLHLAVDGGIVANGGLSAGSASGEGSGGSVNLTVRTLSGLGAISADGGTTGGANHVGGGGGRIALRALDRATYDAARITVRGGDGYYGDGADGTIFLLADGETGGELVINGTGPSSPVTDLLIPPGQDFDSITLQNGANVVAQGPIVLAETLRLRGGSRLAHPSASEAGLSITAREVLVEGGSVIDVTGRGYPGTADRGLTLGFAPGSESGTGGSHGGHGGTYSGGGGTPGPVYGDPKRPDRLGAGGGSWSGVGGPGGGRIRIVASDRVVVDGAIRANGGLSQGSASGEGAGGSVWIETQRLSGTGTISADGGTTAGANHVGGGGGRVALEVGFVDPSADLDGLRAVTAAGGDGYYGDGAAGTVFVRRTGDVEGTLVVDGVQAPGATAPLATVLPAIGPGVVQAVDADTLTLDGTLPALLPDALVGLRLNPDLDQAESFVIAANDATTITVVTPNENGVSFASVAASGDRYAGAWRFDGVILRRGGFLELADPLAVSGTLTLAESAWLTHPETTASYAAGLAIEAGTLTVDASSRIDVSGRGYLGGDRSGLGATAHTVGFAAGAQGGTGGSHGGQGGDYGSNGANVTNPVYGDAADPRELGAGGGAWNGAGGDGGGRARIVAGTIQLDGALRADGGLSGGSASGEGAGGSLDLRVGTLTGAGMISASGGTTAGGNHVGGGGGRIAIRHDGPLGFPLAQVRATGGDGYYGDGGAGSVYLQRSGEPYGDLVFDGNGFAGPEDSVVVPAGLRVRDLVLRNGVRAVAAAPIEVGGTLRLEGGARLTHPPASELGLQIATRDLVVEAGASIDVTGRGYRGGYRSGLGDVAHTLGFAPGAGRAAGGSHGGRGGDYSGNAESIPNPLYGDPARPVRLGAGGGGWSGDGGDGGGAIRIVATGSVRVDGAIRADGGLSGGSASGEGAGGSLWIDAAVLGGTGTLSANGGSTGGANHVGGGGGRVALVAGSLEPGADLSALRGVTALGGDGYYGDGAPGTVYVRIGGQPSGTLVFDAGRTSDRWAPEGGLPPIGPGLTREVGPDSLVVDGWLAPFTPGALVGLRVNPDTSQDESFAIVANDARRIVVATPNENGVPFATVAAAGARYAAAWRFDEVQLRGGASIALADPLVVDGLLAIGERSLLTHPETDGAYAAGLELAVGTLVLDATSRIDVTGRGYLGGDRSGFGTTAATVGFAAGAQGGTGGSHGGLGGDYPGNGANLPNPPYGIAADPRELGSGGGAWSGAGGDGGGRIYLEAGSVQLDGAIRADGGLSSGSISGEGSGGSVNLRVGSFSGAGAISADGGTTGGANHVGGGGGRVAIRYQEGPVPLPNPVTSAGGIGYYGSGEPGTVLIEGP